MRCPQCKTENRDENPQCYHCGSDLTLLRSVVIKARHLFNAALEHTERGRNVEAIANLKSAIELDASFVNAWVVLGTIYAKENQPQEAETAWKRALACDSRFEKAHEYLLKLREISQTSPPPSKSRKRRSA